jgi:hypothetical protein
VSDEACIVERVLSRRAEQVRLDSEKVEGEAAGDVVEFGVRDSARANGFPRSKSANEVADCLIRHLVLVSHRVGRHSQLG